MVNEFQRRASCVPVKRRLYPLSLSVSVDNIQTAETPLSTKKENGEKLETLITSWKPLLRLLQFWGFHTAPVSGRRFLIHFRWSYLLWVYAVFINLLNLCILGICVYTTKVMWSQHGPFHHTTVSSIITGVLPLQNLINLIIFQSGQKIHRQLLEQMKFVDNQFRTKLATQPNVSGRIRVIYGLSGVTLMVPLMVRLLEISLKESESFDNPFNLITLVVVPSLRVWQMLPLFYYEALNSVIRQWHRELNEFVRKDSRLLRNSLSFYYKQFLQLTLLVQRLGVWLNPFIFFSLAFNLTLLCFTIHFFIQTGKELESIEVGFNLAYTTIQVLLGLVHILTICVGGRKTNEEAREILPIVLAIAAKTEEDRFTVIRFVQKLSTQYVWGVTVWRTFPIERSLLFTIFSTVLAWAIYVVNMSKDSSHLAQIQATLMGANCSCMPYT